MRTGNMPDENAKYVLARLHS